MLQTLRKSASGIVAKVLMGLLIISFGIWGIADVFRGFGGQTLASIGSTEISVPEFQQLYQQRLQQISQQLKQGLTPDQARAFGIPDQVLNERLGEAALDEAARRLGLSVSDAQVVERVQQNPSFFGPSGSFDHNYFLQLLRSNGFTEPRFVEAERRLAQRQQLIQSLAGGMEVPQVLKDAVKRYESETRSVNYAILGAANVGPFAEPSEEQLKGFFDARKAAFRAPEFRKISLLALTPEALAGKEEVSDADVKAFYDANQARFGTPERRVIDQIVFPNADEAKAAADKIAAGTSFADIAAERKLEAKDTALGTVTRADIFDAAIADAAFALAAEGTSGVVNGRFGPVIVHVGAITPAAVQPLAEVSADIRKELQLDAARRAMLAAYDKIEDDRNAGATLAEAASKAGLTLQALDTNAQGTAPDGTALPAIPARSDVLRLAFATEVGAENDPITLPQNAGFVWYEVTDVAAPRDRTFEEARAQVLARWKEDETAQALDVKLAELKKKIADGAAFDLTVADAGLELRTANGLRRGRANEGVPQDAVAAIFDARDGAVGSTTLPGDDRLLFKVTSVSLPESAPQNDKIIADIGQSMQNDLMTEYLVQLQSDLGAKINRAALDQIVGVPGEAVN
ncbi:SurA N-terminal domain-containing protein [Ancylobacter defluvii]|uniref:Parvulin-like PPIase n=1 Tax=Ancylobacter defluvii TaxID=1282440 RepID=A0A9W6NAK5_9HYPH|nr:SurA N-terminal domain-containing protein [Ancylobacter defluvii]MBS7587985.1 SurA N-terminal domain-containing protein [Ancylobacter defluvii]GLK83667.1 peptidylprolyl isomerase [Ancylobacter defluvii]